MQQEAIAGKVEKNKSPVAKRNKAAETLVPSKGAIRTAAGFRFTRLELIVKMKSRKRKQKKKAF